MSTIILAEKQDRLQKLGTDIFDYLTMLPKTTRPDKVRTGMQFLFKDPESGGKNEITFPVYQPSLRAQELVVEKLERTILLGDATSQNSEDPETVDPDKRKKFRGCISLSLDGFMLYCSGSGLIGSEDVAAGIIMTAEAAGKSIDYVIFDIKRRAGLLPAEIFDPKHYLFEMMNYYRLVL